jgi:hypothetical protein
MDDELERRLAANEDVFRKVNEGIERGQWPGEPTTPVSFRCECAQLGCNMLLSLTLEEYERVRSHPRRFLVLRGHELPGIERVVEVNGEYAVVEKTGDGGDEAKARDPRA